ncbi:MAG: aminoglycoside phosphotransferase family protein [Clostridia bacterium]|nr:aminoglycoside phosphotransferase family protein [Clostridia bacterium]
MNFEGDLKAIIDRFEFEGSFSACEEIKVGHVNRTYRLRFVLEDKSSRSYVLQRINTFAFKKPEQVMENVRLITEHLSRAMLARGRDPENHVLHLVPTRDGRAMILDGTECWRAYDYVSHAKTVNRVDTPGQFYEIGRAFGEFQNMLSDFPIERLYDTIPDFHDTVKRLEAFERSVSADVMRRADSVADEIAFVRARKGRMGRIVEMIADGSLPLRVTHNDTKINNVMLDINTGEALCVVDLDTVMAGSSLYDYGDAIRFGASTAQEDERDLDKVQLDIGLFRGFSDGFIGQTARDLTPLELESLPLGALVMTFEVGLRFLTDYLDGDRYFRIEYPDHNLVRARCQFKLLTDMEAHEEDMKCIVGEMIKKYRV